MKQFRAFTLIELLVVIAILGLLISILVPAINSTAKQSHTLRCKNNQRDLVVASFSYQSEHGIYPPAIYYEQIGGTWNTVTWDTLIWDYCTTPEAAFTCPEHQHARGGSGSGYNYNTDFIGAEASVLQGLEEARKGIAPSACKHPAHAAMFGDGGEIGGDMAGYRTNRFMRAPNDNDGGLSCAGTQSFRHTGSTVVGWLDGHVSNVTRKFQSNCEYDQWEPNGFLSENESAYDPRTCTMVEYQ
ncbi:MAG: type II secretion system protein [Phycisphaerales bacterium]|nr:type II secretion system protein [Phycisphaerales bacterium]